MQVRNFFEGADKKQTRMSTKIADGDRFGESIGHSSMPFAESEKPWIRFGWVIPSPQILTHQRAL